MAPSIDRMAAFFKRKQSGMYKYTPLDEEASQIRLLALLPGKFPAKVHIRLYTEQLTTEKCPKYEALSYVWGSTEDPVDIFVGSSTEYTLSVTQNLALALPYLRYRDRERVLWIDAICVNQKDLKERSQQVKRMASIYSMAQRVVVWLGQEEFDSTLALQCLERLSTKIDVSFQTRIMKPASTHASESHWADINKRLPFSMREWMSINELLGRAWFERLWIRQEIRLANQDAVMLCGFTVVSWAAFRKAIYCIAINIYTIKAEGFDERIGSVSILCDSPANPSFGQVAEMTKNCRCSDSRDRVYGILSIVCSSERGTDIIEPDYTKSVGEVYEDVVKYQAEHLHSLRLLQYCDLDESNQDMPTWAPDWRRPLIRFGFRYCRASEYSGSDVHFPRKGVLQATGLHLATIQSIDVVQLEEVKLFAVMTKKVRRLAFRMDSEFPLLSNGARLETFCRAINMNIFPEFFNPPPEALPSFEESIKALQWILGSEYDSSSIPEHVQKYLGAFKRRTLGYAFFTTHSGHIGLAPKGAKVNDLVAVLLGCDSATILRPTENGQYQIVGGAYCLGFMNGEAFLGPLPRCFNIAFTFIEGDNSFSRVFFECETGKVLDEDPRLGPLPTGWRIFKMDDGQHRWYVNEDDGEPTRSDPRLCPEILRERGIELKVFEII